MYYTDYSRNGGGGGGGGEMGGAFGCLEIWA